MDNRYYENVIKEMQPFLDENSFKAMEDGSFANDKKSIFVKYDEPKQMYVLSAADIEDGKIGEYADINSWLFDDSQNAKDAVAVGIDFVGSLRKNLGIKIKRKSSTSEIDLPTASKSGSMTVTGFTKKMLDVFPALKDEYKNDVAEKGNFLYLNFFGEHLVPQLKTYITTGSKKQIKKLFDLFDDVYVKGDKETVNVLIAVLCAAAYKDEKSHTAIADMISEDSHFKMSFDAFFPVFSKNKKLIAALIK